AGERCMALSVAVPVGRETADRLREKLVTRIDKLAVGAYDDPDADYGPLVSADAVTRVKDYIQAGIDSGAELVVDGREIAVDGHDGGFYLGSTLFDNVTRDMSIYREEIFGPVLCIVR